MGRLSNLERLNNRLDSGQLSYKELENSGYILEKDFSSHTIFHSGDTWWVYDTLTRDFCKLDDLYSITDMVSSNAGLTVKSNKDLPFTYESFKSLKLIVKYEFDFGIPKLYSGFAIVDSGISIQKDFVIIDDEPIDLVDFLEKAADGSPKERKRFFRYKENIMDLIEYNSKFEEFDRDLCYGIVRAI